LINGHLVSEPFTVTNNSNLTYGIQYGIIDSAAAVFALSDSSEINFKVELLDDQTSVILGEFDKVTYSMENIPSYNNIGYEVNLSGIGNRTVKIRLIINTSANCEYTISRKYSDSEMMYKQGIKQIQYTGNLAVTDYGLDQNYPNPFNPSTNIKYQLPKSGNVSLKIYDILGSEVATLVNEIKTEGRYEVNFDASKLASGVYLYRLRVNDFVSTKKMVLMK